jgi:16S rRNA (uracil1498-N3)-methyltransferase
MTRRRFYAPPSAFADQTITLAADEARHLRDVLRLKTGDEVYVFNGVGREFRCTVSSTRRDSAELRIDAEVEPAKPESQLQLNLCVALLKGEKFDLVVQKATELGVTAIVPVATARSVVRLDRESRQRKLAHWRGIAIAACEQCGRARLPSIAEPVPLAEHLRGAGAGRRLLLSPDAPRSLAAAAHGLESVEMLVGPEGGLEAEEREAAFAASYHPCRIGPRVLRSETAAIVALAVLQAVAGDLGR